jgi:hypothetical protein
MWREYCPLFDTETEKNDDRGKEKQNREGVKVLYVKDHVRLLEIVEERLWRRDYCTLEDCC